jgi:hypothetical protein
MRVAFGSDHAGGIAEREGLDRELVHDSEGTP